MDDKYKFKKKRFFMNYYEYKAAGNVLLKSAKRRKAGFSTFARLFIHIYVSSDHHSGRNGNDKQNRKLRGCHRLTLSLGLQKLNHPCISAKKKAHPPVSQRRCGAGLIKPSEAVLLKIAYSCLYRSPDFRHLSLNWLSNFI